MKVTIVVVAGAQAMAKVYKELKTHFKKDMPTKY